MSKNLLSQIQELLANLSYEDKMKLARDWKSIQLPPKPYECYFVLGDFRLNNRLWVRSARFAGDSLVVDFSSERCLISEDLANAVAPILYVADKGSYRSIRVCYGVVDDPLSSEGGDQV